MKRNVCLVLSGGAARGLAHIGVYAYLLEAGFEIEVLSGSSAGAIVGAFVAAGHRPEEMVQIAKKTNPLSVFKPSIPPKRSLFRNSPVLEFLKDFLPERFEDLKVPLSVSTTDLLEGKNFLISEGPLAEAVMASAALPPFFEPVELKGKLLNDGGFSNDLPVEPFLEKDCLKLCVDVTPVLPVEGLSGWIETTIRSFLISIRHHKVAKYRLCDLVLVPAVSRLGFVNYKRVDEYVEAGYREAEKFLS